MTETEREEHFRALDTCRSTFVRLHYTRRGPVDECSSWDNGDAWNAYREARIALAKAGRGGGPRLTSNSAIVLGLTWWVDVYGEIQPKYPSQPRELQVPRTPTS